MTYPIGKGEKKVLPRKGKALRLGCDSVTQDVKLIAPIIGSNAITNSQRREDARDRISLANVEKRGICDRNGCQEMKAMFGAPPERLFPFSNDKRTNRLPTCV